MIHKKELQKIVGNKLIIISTSNNVIKWRFRDSAFDSFFEVMEYSSDEEDIELLGNHIIELSKLKVELLRMLQQAKEEMNEK